MDDSFKQPVSSRLLFSRPKQHHHHEDTRFMMDTIVTIETTGKSEDTLKSTTDKAFAAFQEIADETDSYAPHGPKDLYAINEKAGTGPKKRPPTSLPS